MRACGTAIARRVSRPLRSSTAEATSDQPLRRHDNGSSQRARGVAGPAGVGAVAEHRAVPHRGRHAGRQHREHEPRVVEGADRQQGRLAVALALAGATGAGDVDPDPPPADRAPPQRLHELEGLDAVQRDRRGPQVGQSLLHAHRRCRRRRGGSCRGSAAP